MKPRLQRPPGGGVLARRRQAAIDAHGTAHPPDRDAALRYRCAWREIARRQQRIRATLRRYGILSVVRLTRA